MIDIEQLIKENHHTALRMAFRILRNNEDAEDAVQRACIKAFLHAEGFKFLCEPSTWFLTIVRNESLMVKRSFRRNRNLEICKEVEKLLIHFDTPERYAIQEERFRLIKDFIDKLPRLLRNSLNRKIQTDCFVRATRMKARLHRGRIRLREKIDRANLQELYKVA